MTVTFATIAVAALALAPVSAEDNEATRCLHEASEVFSEIVATPDKGIPTDLLEKSPRRA